MFYITGDTHGDFSRLTFLNNIEQLQAQRDTLIVLGDAGINYYGGRRDAALKQALTRFPLTLFCIHGNHEMRPEGLASYTESIWNGGTVYMEPEYPNILFAKDGEIFDLDGIMAITIGGAYSVDKFYRIEKGYRWFEDEQPSEDIKIRVEQKLYDMNWRIDTVLSHTCPLKFEPTDVFIQCIDQGTVDRSTEMWLDSIEKRLAYSRWFAGHYHAERQIDKLQFLYKSIQQF